MRPAMTPAKSDEFAGRYALDASPAFVMSFSRSADTLHAQATGQPKFRLVPTSDSSFALQGVAASVEFARDTAKTVDAVYPSCRTAPVSGPRAGSAGPPGRCAVDAVAGDLAAISGRYFSEELDLLGHRADERHARRQAAPRRGRAAAPGRQGDTFTGGAVTLTLERDRAGQVIGFYANVARSRDIRFERVP